MKTVLMQFPDGSRAPVPTDAIAMARKAGAKPYRVVPPVTFGPGGVPVQADPKFVADMAPPMGGVTGSVLGEAAGSRGGPVGKGTGRVVGGVAGGAIGKAYQEGAYRTMGLGDAPGTVGDEAKFQAKAGLIGEGLGAVSNVTGRGIIRSGLPARLQDEWKAVSEMVRERLPVGGVGPFRGGARAGRNLAKKTAARDAVNAAAGAAGTTLPAGPMEQKMLEMVDRYQLRGDRSSQLSALSRRMDDFMETWKTGRLSPADAQEYLTSLDEEAKTLWKATNKMGQHVPEAERKAAQQAKQIAGVLRQEFRARVPGHLKASKRLSSAIAAKNAIDESEHMGMLSLGSRLATGALLGTGVEQFTDPHRDAAGYITKAMTGMLLAHPSLSSRVGLSLAGGATNQLARQAPRMVSPELLRLLNLSNPTPER